MLTLLYTIYIMWVSWMLLENFSVSRLPLFVYLNSQTPYYVGIPSGTSLSPVPWF